MADYFAVLDRTLSGFTDPKPQMRMKLYERARGTIRRQLEGRTPPPDPATLSAELAKLEDAITAIERGFDPGYEPAQADASGGVAAPASDPIVPEPVPSQSVPEPSPVAEQAVEPVVTPEPAPAPVAETPLYQAPEQPVYSDPQAAAPMPGEALPDPQPVIAPEPAPEPLAPEPVVETAPQPATISSHAEPVVSFSPAPPAEPMPMPAPVPAPESIAPAPVEPAIDPVDEWAQEFMSPDPTPAAPAPQPGLSSAMHDLENQVTAANSSFTNPADDLTIPPAPGFGSPVQKRPKRHLGRWLLLLFFIVLLAALATYGWMYRAQVMDTLGFSTLSDDLTRPKPVKTISIAPEPEPEPTPETPAPASQSEPKLEQRLDSSGREIAPAVEPTTNDQVLLPQSQQTQPADPAPAPSSTLAVSQSAILYEEGASRDKNSFDAGRVIWSTVDEPTGTGTDTEPAIRARVEIPGRNVVLIMTLKKNVDKALPASHLIELVFAVPDDFSGGAIDGVNRYVLKESEQGQGTPLVGVPARIADGIFLIALNNLDQAKEQNITLLKNRSWIDIPLQYRTGRRALITIEKGVPGEKIFNDVFRAWGEG